MIDTIHYEDNTFILNRDSYRFPYFSILIPIETKDDSGIYHLLEHIISRCEDDFFTKGNIEGSHIFQASTDYHFITFYFTTRCHKICQMAAKMLINKILDVDQGIDSKIFEVEAIRWNSEESCFSGVIYSEISNTVNNPKLLAELCYFREKSEHNVYGYFNEGYPEPMSQLTISDLERAHQSIASPENWGLFTNVSNLAYIFSQYKCSHKERQKPNNETLYHQPIKSKNLKYNFIDLNPYKKELSIAYFYVLSNLLSTSENIANLFRSLKVYYRAIYYPRKSGILFFSKNQDINEDCWRNIRIALFDKANKSDKISILSSAIIKSTNFHTAKKCAPLLEVEFIKRHAKNFSEVKNGTFIHDISTAYQQILKNKELIPEQVFNIS